MCSVIRIRSDVDGRATTWDTQAGNKIAAFSDGQGMGYLKTSVYWGGILEFGRLKRKCLVTLVRKFTEQEAWCARRP